MDNDKHYQLLSQKLSKRGHQFLPLLRCPVTGSSLEDHHTHFQTPDGSHIYQFEAGILRLLTPEQKRAFAAEELSISTENQSNDWQSPTPDDFRQLPQTGLDGWPLGYWQRRAEITAEMWRVIEHIRVDEERLPIGPMGNAVDFTDDMGWIAYGLDMSGYTTIAVSQSIGSYGLGVFDHSRYLRVQAAIDNPPLTPEQFDLVVFSFSLKTPQPTLDHAVRLLKKGGLLIVMADKGNESIQQEAGTALQSLGFEARFQRVGAMGNTFSRTLKNLVGYRPDVPPLVVVRRQR
ncbi:MAG: methyltransferase domain-containing protein [Anaerolineales bacterium]|nr:methyltransferase domain-containing protein [Anaerolineales bacterium]